MSTPRNPLWWFQSRKVQTAVATIIVSLLAAWGLDVPEEHVLAIIGLGASIVLGIAIEDHAAKQ